jgi:hypothetical protein
MTCTSTGAPIAHAFDPAAWLAEFEANGGGYILADALNLIIRVLGNSYANAAQAKRMIGDLTQEQIDALIAHLTAAQADKQGEV